MSSVGQGAQVVTGASAEHSATAKRVVLYCMNYAPEMAGVGRYTGEIADFFAARGADVTVVSTPPHYPGWRVQEGYANTYSQRQESSVRVLRCPLILRERMGGIWRVVAPLTFALSSAPVVVWQILRKRPHVVFCVEPTLFAAPAAQLAAKLVGASTVLHVQDLEVDAAFAVGHLGSRPWLKKLGYAFEQMTLKRFRKVITISERMAEKLREKGVDDDRLDIVRNWVDLSHIYPLEAPSRYRKELGFSDGDFVTLYSGNVGAKQGLGVLLDAAERLRDEPSAHFVIAGEGPMKAELQVRYGHLPNVRFLPFQPYARLNEFLNMADLHALPQDKGAADLVLPSKLGGMLASGKPLIVTADEGTELTDFLRGAAIITPPGDADALANGIRMAMLGTATTRDSVVVRELCTALARENSLANLARSAAL